MSEYYEDKHRYDDLLDLPHHRSTERKHMSLHDRAAQFSPFAALTGYDAAIEETQRPTDEEIILDETMVAKINEQLSEIALHLSEKWQVTITYFQPDARKSGGAYLTDTGTVKRIDEVEHIIRMDSGIEISMERIASISYDK